MIKTYWKRKFYEYVHSAKAKYSKKIFLKKFIKKFTYINYVRSWLLPLMCGMAFFYIMIAIIEYIRDGGIFNLLLVFMGITTFIFLVVLTHVHISYFSAFIDGQIESWKKELNEMIIEESNG